MIPSKKFISLLVFILSGLSILAVLSELYYEKVLFGDDLFIYLTNGNQADKLAIATQARLIDVTYEPDTGGMSYHYLSNQALGSWKIHLIFNNNKIESWHYKYNSYLLNLLNEESKKP